MKRRGLQLSPRHRGTLYTFGCVLLITGLIWYWLHWLDLSGQSSETLRELSAAAEGGRASLQPLAPNLQKHLLDGKRRREAALRSASVVKTS